MIWRVLWIMLFYSFFYGCTVREEEHNFKNDTIHFFELYAQREDSEAFLDCYADSILFEDIMLGEQLKGKEALNTFFDWNAEGYEMLEDKCLSVSEILIDDSIACVSGVFLPFSWEGTSYSSMHFLIKLHFDDAGKICKQTDWINYPSNLLDYQNRKDSNRWIGE